MLGLTINPGHLAPMKEDRGGTISRNGCLRRQLQLLCPGGIGQGGAAGRGGDQRPGVGVVREARHRPVPPVLRGERVGAVAVGREGSCCRRLSMRAGASLRSLASCPIRRSSSRSRAAKRRADGPGSPRLPGRATRTRSPPVEDVTEPADRCGVVGASEAKEERLPDRGGPGAVVLGLPAGRRGRRVRVVRGHRVLRRSRSWCPAAVAGVEGPGGTEDRGGASTAAGRFGPRP